jgi:hypothetical protein
VTNEARHTTEAAISARLTLARAHRALGQVDPAAVALEHAAKLAREHARPAQLREVLTEWADLRASLGDAGGAYQLSREVLELART